MQSGGRAEKHSVKKMRETPPGERDVELSPWEPPTKPQRRARPSATKARHRLTLLPPGDFPWPQNPAMKSSQEGHLEAGARREKFLLTEFQRNFVVYCLHTNFKKGTQCVMGFCKDLWAGHSFVFSPFVVKSHQVVGRKPQSHFSSPEDPWATVCHHSGTGVKWRWGTGLTTHSRYQVIHLGPAPGSPWDPAPLSVLDLLLT